MEHMSFLLRKGRLGSPEASAVEFASSIEEDRRIATASVLVNEAHVAALVKARIVDRDDGRKLALVLRRLENNPPFRKGVEDIHVLIEEEVARRLGVRIGGKLHTGKSRNDQVTTAIRMVLRQELLKLANQILAFELQLIRIARKHRKSLFVGYTHLQPAQPITFAHYLLAVGDSLLRDHQRIMETFGRVNLSPMGAGALAGSSFKLDRQLVARLLGFRDIVENTLDAVGGRDFLLEALGVCSILALDLSRICQDLVFYSSADVGLINLPDEFTSTRSIMPQKKNPDVFEVIRARCARVAGNFTTAVTTLHALPTGYNLDYQELTPLLWNTLDTLKPCVEILSKLVGKLRLSRSSFEPHVELTAATEVANVLVRSSGIPFRQAHQAVGRAVILALSRNTGLQGLTREDWNGIIPNLPAVALRNMARATNLDLHIQAYKTKGSPNPKETSQLIGRREDQVKELSAETKQFASKINRSLTELHRTAYR